MSVSLAFLILSPERLCSSKDFKVLKVHKHKFMLFSFATISYHRSKKSASSKMHYSSSKLSSTKGRTISSLKKPTVYLYIVSSKQDPSKNKGETGSV